MTAGARTSSRRSSSAAPGRSRSAWTPGPTQGFESSWPAIAAGDGGRLLVVWVQEFGASDRMFSASLQPGSRRFEAPVPVDLNVGDSSLGTYPAIAMAPGGQAYLVYRVITDAQPSSAPPGNVLGEYRLTRYTGQLWSGFGAPFNRNLAAAQPTPSQANRPQIGIDQLGNAVVAWQELDDAFIPRIYARRVFPSSTGIALQVSPSELGGAPLRAGADQFSLDVAAFGAAAIAWRQQPPPGAGSFTRPRLFVSQSPNEYSTDAAAFAAPRAIDNGGADGPAGALGGVDVSAGDPALLMTFGLDSSAFARDADEQTLQDPVRIDGGGATAPLDPLGELGASGAAALAWKANAGSRGSVVVRERRSDGVTTDRSLSAPRGGQVDALASPAPASATRWRASRRAPMRAARWSPAGSTRRPTSSTPSRRAGGCARRRSRSAGTPRCTRSATCRTTS